MLQIGKVHLDSPVLLAPVAGHCDLALRLTVRACGGVGLAFTDLLCPHGVLKQNSQTQWLMATCPEDRPLGMQLYGSDPRLMAQAARWAVERGATTIDINMGCPVDKVTKTWAGSMMLCTPDNTLRVAQTIVAAVGDCVPVTAKTRLGFHHGERTGIALARRLIDVGIACITIHGRTAEQRFKGSADWDAIAEFVGAVHEAGGGRVPCIGNGDIRTPFDAQRMIRHTGCDGVMIARAALGAPWIFRDTHSLLTSGQIAQELTLRERLGVIQDHYAQMRRLREPRWAVKRLRSCMGGYGVHLGPCKPLKLAVQEMTEGDADRLAEIVESFLDSVGPAADRVPVTWRQRQVQLEASAGPRTLAA